MSETGVNPLRPRGHMCVAYSYGKCGTYMSSRSQKVNRLVLPKVEVQLSLLPVLECFFSFKSVQIYMKDAGVILS